MKKLQTVILASSTLIAAAPLSAQDWHPMDNGLLNGVVMDMMIMPDSSIVVAGSFRADGDGVPLNGICRWENGQFQTLSGMEASSSSNIYSISDLVMKSDELCFVVFTNSINPDSTDTGEINLEGQIIPLNQAGVVCYDGETFTPLPFPRPVTCLSEVDNKLYAGRSYESAGIPSPENGLSRFPFSETIYYRWDNGQVDSISGLDLGMTPLDPDYTESFTMNMVEWNGGALFVSPHAFYQDTLTRVFCIWNDEGVEVIDGNSIHPHSGMYTTGYEVEDLHLWNNELWVSRIQFDGVGAGVGRFDGEWDVITEEEMGVATNSSAISFCDHAGWLYVLYGSTNSYPGGFTVEIHRTLNGENWEFVSSFTAESVFKTHFPNNTNLYNQGLATTLYRSNFTLKIFNNHIYTGYHFEDVNGIPVNNIVQWNGIDQLGFVPDIEILPAHHTKETGAIGVGFSDGIIGEVLFSVYSPSNELLESHMVSVNGTKATINLDTSSYVGCKIKGTLENQSWWWSISESN